MKLFICGPMSGIALSNGQRFADVANWLRSMGHEAVNPVELNRGYLDQWRKCRDREIVEMLKCDGIVKLEGWKKSRGARMELALADGLGIPAFDLKEVQPAQAKGNK